MLLVQVPKLDLRNALIDKLLRRYAMTHSVRLNKNRKAKALADHLRHCTYTRPPHLLNEESNVASLLLTSCPSRLLRYFRYRRLDGNLNRNRLCRRCAQLRGC